MSRCEPKLLRRYNIEEISAFEAGVAFACVKRRFGIDGCECPEFEFDCLAVTTACVSYLCESL